jgi:spore germination cell wall hydrolase CwlJ-like protein
MNLFDQEIMARTAMGEARGEGEEGMIAVLWTVVNRFKAEKWFSGLTLAGTCLKRQQYSCWNPSDVNYAYIANITPDIGLFRTALTLAAGVITGGMPDNTQGATHYKTIGAIAEWATGLTPCVTIGHHEFYNNVA